MTADSEWQKALTLAGNPELAASMDMDIATTGYQGLLCDWMEGLKQVAKDRYVSPYGIAQSNARLGENGPALEWVAKAHHEHDSRLVALRVDPCFDALRTEPKFQELIKRIGIPQQPQPNSQATYTYWTFRRFGGRARLQSCRIGAAYVGGFSR